VKNKMPRSGAALWTKLALTAALVVGPLASALPASAAPAAPASGNGQAKVLNQENAETFLNDFFSLEQVKPNFQGAAVVIVKDGKVVIEKGFGYADVAAKTPVDPAETVFRMASVSKTFTAAAVMQLVEQGKIKLEEDFRTYTGPLTFDNPFSSPVTVGHLLTHTTGFRVQDPQAADIHPNLDSYVSIEDYVKSHMPPVVREPGTSYMYDNFASLLAGLVVEKVSGEPFEDYMQQHIFGPLGMDKSGFLLEGKLRTDLASGYDITGKLTDLYAVTPTVMPHGGMLSTAEDIGKFMNAFLDGGVLDGKRILSESSVEVMEQYRSGIHPLMPDTTYGFEAAVQLPAAGSNPAIITKAGDLIGFSSFMVLIPEQNLGLFLVSNQAFPLRELLYPAFMKEFYPQYALAADFSDYKPEAESKLERFAGYYSDLRLKSIVSKITVEDGQLMISDAFLGPRPLTQVDDTLFTDSLTGKLTAFKLDENGNSLYLKEPYLNYLGYEQKGAQAAGYTDIPADHPYAEPIRMLQSLGHLENTGGQTFAPKTVVTRSEFLRKVLEVSGVSGSPATTKLFSDTAGHPDEAYIQAAVELDMIKGTGKGQFQPDRGITRQEAASMLWSFYKLQYPDELFMDVELTGKVDKWAVSAVKMMVALGIHGPEVQADANGAADYHAKAQLTKQEMAAILYALFMQPTDQIAAARMQP